MPSSSVSVDRIVAQCHICAMSVTLVVLNVLFITRSKAVVDIAVSRQNSVSLSQRDLCIIFFVRPAAHKVFKKFFRKNSI